jgi:hypothetical protein
MLSQMRVQGTGRRLPLAAAAVAGAAFGHTLLYLVAVPDTQARAAVLAGTGHGYWSVAVAAAIVLGLLSLATTAGRQLLTGLGRRQPLPDPGDLGALARRLVLLQAGIFVVQEVVERLAAGAPLSGLVAQHGVLLNGVLVQVLVALGVAAVLHLLGRAAEAVGRALRRPPARPSRRVAVPWPALPARASRRPGPAAAIRGPPLATT